MLSQPAISARVRPQPSQSSRLRSRTQIFLHGVSIDICSLYQSVQLVRLRHVRQSGVLAQLRWRSHMLQAGRCMQGRPFDRCHS
jgi:hypothetical protein